MKRQNALATLEHRTNRIVEAAREGGFTLAAQPYLFSVIRHCRKAANARSRTTFDREIAAAHRALDQIGLDA